MEVKIFKLLIISVIFATLASCSSNTKQVKVDNSIIVDATAIPRVHFPKKDHDFGLIQQGEKVSYVFKVQNIGNANLVISNAKASCGCTVPKFSAEPIPPGGEGEVEVVFDSHNRTGRQTKSITVYTNCNDATTRLSITSNIVVPSIN